MKKSMLWRGLILLLLTVSPAMVSAQPTGTTDQYWDFEQETGRFGILPTEYNNLFGEPVVALIADMSGNGVGWNDGTWQGDEFKILLDIPNQPIANPYKHLWIDLKYKGEISFLWVADVDTGEHFTLLDPGQSVEDPVSGWKTLSQMWRFEPNPREEIVVIGLKGTGSIPGINNGTQAIIDSIYINTECVPEPATISLLAIGAGSMVRKRYKNRISNPKSRRVI